MIIYYIQLFHFQRKALNNKYSFHVKLAYLSCSGWNIFQKFANCWALGSIKGQPSERARKGKKREVRPYHLSGMHGVEVEPAMLELEKVTVGTTTWQQLQVTLKAMAGTGNTTTYSKKRCVYQITIFSISSAKLISKSAQTHKFPDAYIMYIQSKIGGLFSSAWFL